MVYGIRRWFQDKLNSEAHAVKLARHAAKAAGEEFTGNFGVQAAFTARLESAVSGVLSAPRSSSSIPAFTPIEEALYDSAYKNRSALPAIAAALKAAKGEDTNTRKLAVLSAISSLPEAARAILQSTAEATVALAAALQE